VSLVCIADVIAVCGVYPHARQTPIHPVGLRTEQEDSHGRPNENSKNNVSSSVDGHGEERLRTSELIHLDVFCLLAFLFAALV
jgi:hypothetical protein